MKPQDINGAYCNRCQMNSKHLLATGAIWDRVEKCMKCGKKADVWCVLNAKYLTQEVA